jgi:hypothetical protein
VYHLCLIIPKPLKHSLFLSGQFIQSAAVILSIGVEASVQGFQPVETFT